MWGTEANLDARKRSAREVEAWLAWVSQNDTLPRERPAWAV